MEYRLFVETAPAKDATGWSFLFYNHQDFNVYKFCGKSESTDEKSVILEVAARALTYFSNFMRRRYYDEHFATILDEDYVTVYTALPDLAAVWSSKSYERGFTGGEGAGLGRTCKITKDAKKRGSSASSFFNDYLYLRLRAASDFFLRFTLGFS